MRMYKDAKEEIKRELSGTASSHNRMLYLHRLIERAHQTVRPDVILELYNSYWDTFLKNSTLLPGAIELLRYIREKGLPIVVVTNLTTHIQMRRVDALRLNDYVDYIVTSEEAGQEKPHPSPFLLACNKVEVLPKEVVFVGDSPDSDIEGGNAVGMTTVRITANRDFDPDELPEYQKADYVVEELAKIMSILDDLEHKLI